MNRLEVEALMVPGEVDTRNPLQRFADALDIDQPWRGDAACREHPEVSFFPRLGQAAAPAKAICASCLVREECLTYAVEHNLVGLWGGTSDGERRALRRRLAA